MRWRRLGLGVAATALCISAGAPLFIRGSESARTRTVREKLRPFLAPPGPLRHRVLLVGWDGATFDIIDPLVASGNLPNVRRMLQAGTSAELESTITPISAAAWTAAVTGKGPGKTGILSFFKPASDS